MASASADWFRSRRTSASASRMAMSRGSSAMAVSSGAIAFSGSCKPRKQRPAWMWMAADFGCSLAASAKNFERFAEFFLGGEQSTQIGQVAGGIGGKRHDFPQVCLCVAQAAQLAQGSGCAAQGIDVSGFGPKCCLKTPPRRPPHRSSADGRCRYCAGCLANRGGVSPRLPACPGLPSAARIGPARCRAAISNRNSGNRRPPPCDRGSRLRRSCHGAAPRGREPRPGWGGVFCCGPGLKTEGTARLRRIAGG